MAISRAVAAANPTTLVLVDDRCDVALAARQAGAPVHGVHLGQRDIPVNVARAILGPEAIVGLTAYDTELICAANVLGDAVDYVGAGPFRATPTKAVGKPLLGLTGYPPLVAVAEMPVVAIGDVTVDDVADLRRTGVAGVCMVREIMSAPDPADVVRRALAAWNGAG